MPGREGSCGWDGYSGVALALAVLPDRLEAVADGVELVADFVGETPHADDGSEGDERSDERILDQVLPGIVGQQGLEPTL